MIAPLTGFSLYVVLGCLGVIALCGLIIASRKRRKREEIANLIEIARVRSQSKTEPDGYKGGIEFDMAMNMARNHDNHFIARQMPTPEQQRVIDVILTEDYDTDFDKHFTKD